jgi:hypothetical protein
VRKDDPPAAIVPTDEGGGRSEAAGARPVDAAAERARERGGASGFNRDLEAARVVHRDGRRRPGWPEVGERGRLDLSEAVAERARERGGSQIWERGAGPSARGVVWRCFFSCILRWPA